MLRSIEAREKQTGWQICGAERGWGRGRQHIASTITKDKKL